MCMKNLGQRPQQSVDLLKKLGGPKIVCVFPDPVCPYMNMVQLIPPMNDLINGSIKDSYTSSCEVFVAMIAEKGPWRSPSIWQ